MIFSNYLFLKPSLSLNDCANKLKLFTGFASKDPSEKFLTVFLKASAQVTLAFQRIKYVENIGQGNGGDPVIQGVSGTISPGSSLCIVDGNNLGAGQILLEVSFPTSFVQFCHRRDLLDPTPQKVSTIQIKVSIIQIKVSIIHKSKVSIIHTLSHSNKKKQKKVSIFRLSFCSSPLCIYLRTMSFSPDTCRTCSLHR